METLLVRLKHYDPRRGFVLRRFTYGGIRFQAERGWYRVEKSLGERLRAIRQVQTDEHSPVAFDVCDDEQAKALEASEQEASRTKRSATDDLKVVPARSGAPVDALPAVSPVAGERGGQRSKRE